MSRCGLRAIGVDVTMVVIFVAATVIILHRNPKVLIICGTPIVMSLARYFGITVMANIELTPMIIAAGPILIGLGVDYALHLINRIEENRNERLEEAAEEAWREQRRLAIRRNRPLGP